MSPSAMRKATKISYAAVALFSLLAAFAFFKQAQIERETAKIALQEAQANQNAKADALAQAEAELAKKEAEAARAEAEVARAIAERAVAEARERAERLRRETAKLNLQSAQQEAANFKNDIERIEALVRGAMDRIYAAMHGRSGLVGQSPPVRPVVEFRPSGTDLELDIGYEVATAEITHYPPGKYSLKDSPFGLSTIALLVQALETELATFVHKNAKLSVDILGQADGLPVIPGSRYRGELGHIQAVNYYSVDSQQNRVATFYSYRSTLTNEDIAFLRAYGAALALWEVDAVRNGEVRLFADTVSSIGPSHRKVFIRARIKDGLQEKYNALSDPAKLIVDQWLG